jgi:hypothetical protein
VKIRHPVLLSSFGLCAPWIIRAWMATTRFAHHSLDPNVKERSAMRAARGIWAFWHESLLLPLYHYADARVAVLISHHADGTFITGACRQMGLRVVRGSTTRGGTEAIQELLAIARRRSLVITPDGPRGPRRRVQPGVVFLASRTGLPIVPLGFGCSDAWRMRSWDRFAVPKPGSLATCVAAQALHVPENVNRKVLETYRIELETRMATATAAAEEMARGKRPLPVRLVDQRVNVA